MNALLRIVASASFLCLTHLASAQSAEAPYVPTPTAIVERMMAMAKIGPGDHVIDLGSGDGRLVITAVSKYKAKSGVGIDIDPALVILANENAAKAGVSDRVRFVEGDLYKADIGDATLVTLYLLPTMLGDVEKKLTKELKPGTRVISHDYPLPSWKPVDVVAFELPEKVAISGTPRTVLYLYRAPGK